MEGNKLLPHLCCKIEISNQTKLIWTPIQQETPHPNTNELKIKETQDLRGKPRCEEKPRDWSQLHQNSTNKQ